MARTLIVDDEKSIRRTLGEFLRAAGHEVVEAEDADVARQRLAEAEFDVVVTDIILPRMSGVGLLQHIHATAPYVQVVMMTGEPTVETAATSLRTGSNSNGWWCSARRSWPPVRRAIGRWWKPRATRSSRSRPPESSRR
jgi:DNA-binding NtrC family response regulator